MSYTYSDTTYFFQNGGVFISSSLCAISNMQLYRPPLPSNLILPILSLNTPTQKWCQPSVYVNILIVLLTSHDCLGDGRQKRAPGQVTERSIDAHLACLGRTHRPASNPLSPASGAPTWLASVPPRPPRYQPSRPTLAVPKGKHIHGRQSIYVGFLKNRKL